MAQEGQARPRINWGAVQKLRIDSISRRTTVARSFAVILFLRHDLNVHANHTGRCDIYQMGDQI